MSQLADNELYQLFHQLKQTEQTELEDYDREGYAALATDTARLQWLQDLSSTLQAAVDTKAREIADLESEVDDLRAAATALQAVAHRVKLSLGIAAVEGQLPLLTTATNTAESGV